VRLLTSISERTWLIREEELDDQPPALWWEEHLSRIRPGRAEQAEGALRRTTSRGRNRGEVLAALRWVSNDKRALPMRRRHLLARAEELRRLLDAARKTKIDVLRYPVVRLHIAVQTILDDAPDHLAALKKDADARRRDREGPMNSVIVELLREVARAAGGRATVM
jgi:hypothetical protein